MFFFFSSFYYVFSLFLGRVVALKQKKNILNHRSAFVGVGVLLASRVREPLGWCRWLVSLVGVVGVAQKKNN